jgi:hypothetical protein
MSRTAAMLCMTSLGRTRADVFNRSDSDALAIAASRHVEFEAMLLFSLRDDQTCRAKTPGFTSLRRIPAALLILLSTAPITPRALCMFIRMQT